MQRVPEHVTITTQGHFVRVRVGKAYPPPDLPTRGNVTDFSKASRRRLLEICARLDQNRAGFVAFLTLTCPKRFPGPRRAKAALRAFLERLRRDRRYSGASAIWRMEPQWRGAPHFHLIIFNLEYLPQSEVRQWWAEILHEYVEGVRPFVRIEKIRSWHGVLFYAAKYLGKKISATQLEACERTSLASGFLDCRAYSHAGSEDSEPRPDDWRRPGRWWGVFRGDELPFADREVIRLPFGGWYHKFRRWAQRLNAQIPAVRTGCTFQVMVQDAREWQRLALYAWQSSVPPPAELDAWQNRTEIGGYNLWRWIRANGLERLEEATRADRERKRLKLGRDCPYRVLSRGMVCDSQNKVDGAPWMQ